MSQISEPTKQGQSTAPPFKMMTTVSDWNKVLPSIHKILECDTLDCLRSVTLKELDKIMGGGQYSWVETNEVLRIFSYQSLHKLDLKFLGYTSNVIAEKTLVALGCRFITTIHKVNPEFMAEFGFVKRISRLKKVNFMGSNILWSSLRLLRQDKIAFSRLATQPTGRNMFIFAQRGQLEYSDNELSLISTLLKFSTSQFNLLHKVYTRVKNSPTLLASAKNFRISSLNIEAIQLLKNLENNDPCSKLEIPKALKKDVKEYLTSPERKASDDHKILHKIKLNATNYLYRVSFCPKKSEITIEIISSEWLKKLTLRQIDVVLLLKKNLSKCEIASSLFLSERTVDGHCEQIYERLGVNSRFEVMSLCNLD